MTENRLELLRRAYGTAKTEWDDLYAGGVNSPEDHQRLFRAHIKEHAAWADYRDALQQYGFEQKQELMRGV